MSTETKQNEQQKQLIVTLISIVLFYLIGNHGRIHTGVFMSYIYLQYPLLCIVSILYGPVSGFFTGLIGHIMIDSTYSHFVWVSWVTGSGVFGLLLGLAAKYKLFHNSRETFLENNDKSATARLRLRYAVIIMGASLISFTVVGTIIHLIVYSDPVTEVLKQGLFIGLSDGLTSLIVSDIMFTSFRHTILRRIVAVLTLLNSLEMISYGNTSIGSMILYVITFVFALYLFFYKQWHTRSKYLAITIGKSLLFHIVILYALALLLIAGLAYLNRPSGDEQVAVVLGAGLNGEEPSQILKMRLDKTYEWFQKDPSRIIVTSGGQGNDEIIAEGQAMKNYLMKKGVPAEHILVENKSTTTEENFRYSLSVLADNNIDSAENTICVTNNFHCFRALQYAKKEGFQHMKALASPTPVFGIIPNFSRECLAIIKYLLKTYL